MASSADTNRKEAGRLDVHRRLHEQGKADNAVQLVALQVLDQARLLCLDEVEGESCPFPNLEL